MTSERTPAFFLANLGAEVKRLTDALQKGDRELGAGALRRAEGIFDALAKMQLRTTEREELKVLREVIEDLPRANPRFGENAESLESYFYPFARKVLGV